MPQEVRKIGTCKNCYRDVGYDSMHVLVHCSQWQRKCSPNSKKVAELRQRRS